MRSFSVEKGAVCLFTDRLTRKYLCGADIAEGYLFVANGEVGNVKTVFTDSRYFFAAKETLAKVGVDCRLYKDKGDLAAFVKELGVKALYIDFNRTTVSEYFAYGELCSVVKDCSSDIEKFRSVKTPEEIANIGKACEIIQKAYYAAISTVRLGMTETQLKDVLENFIIEFGGEGVSFDTIVAFGANSAVPHHETGDTVLTENSVILIDTGCKVNGYCSDLTRTAFFGTPTEKFLSSYEAVLKANQLAIGGIYSGINSKDADSIARDFLKGKRIDKYFTHSLGHGVGLEIHEYPRLSPKSGEALIDGMTFTIEPGVYFDGEFGIRIEDTVVLNGGVQRLFTDDKNLLIIKN